MQRINDLGLNPGGEALIMAVPRGMYPTGRLLTRADVESLGCTRSADLSEGERAEVDEAATLVCEHHNVTSHA